MQVASLLLRQARRSLAQFVDQFRGCGFGEVVVERLTGVAAQRFQIGTLGGGHRLVAGLPLVRIALQSLSIALRRCHGENTTQTERRPSRWHSMRIDSAAVRSPIRTDLLRNLIRLRSAWCRASEGAATGV